MVAHRHQRQAAHACRWSTYFPKIQKSNQHLHAGLGRADLRCAVQPAVAGPHAWAPSGDGNYNVGSYSNPKADALIDQLKTETDLPVRNRLLTEALQMSNDDVGTSRCTTR